MSLDTFLALLERIMDGVNKGVIIQGNVCVS